MLHLTGWNFIPSTDCKENMKADIRSRVTLVSEAVCQCQYTIISWFRVRPQAVASTEIVKHIDYFIGDYGTED